MSGDDATGQRGAGDGRPAGDQRRAGDRRSRPTPWFSRYWLTGRRRGGRRGGEQRGIYVDRYRPSDWALSAGVMLCCVADAVFTLDILRHGGSEWNPLMAALIAHGVWVFFAVKVGITLAGVLFLLTHTRFPFARRGACLLLVLYALLMGWHAWIRWDAPVTPAAVAATAPLHPGGVR